MRIFSLAVTAVCLAEFSAAAYSIGQDYSVQGYVTTPEGTPVGNIFLDLLDANGSTKCTIHVDESGHFRFENLPSGKYYVRAESVRTPFESTETGFVVGGGLSHVFINVVMPRSQPADPLPANGLNLFYQKIPKAAREDYSTALKFFKKKDVAQGIGLLHHALTIFPDYYDALDALATQYVQDGEYSSAVTLLNRAALINGNGWHVQYVLGLVLLRLNERQEGIARLRQAARLDPLAPGPPLELGIALSNDAQFSSEAIQAFEKAVLIPGKRIPEAYLYLASLLGKTNRFREAAKALECYVKFSTKIQPGQREQYRNQIAQWKQKAKSQPKP